MRALAATQAPGRAAFAFIFITVLLDMLAIGASACSASRSAWVS